VGWCRADRSRSSGPVVPPELHRTRSRCRHRIVSRVDQSGKDVLVSAGGGHRRDSRRRRARRPRHEEALVTSHPGATMRFRNLLVVALALVLGGMLASAADAPYIGKWKMNVAKSDFGQ